MIPAVMPTYSRTEFAFERGEGMYLYTTEGRRFLDFGAGIAVNALGHAHPRLVEALQRQSEKLWHTSNLYRSVGQEKVAAKLVANSFAESVFFCNSGAEAMEAVFKATRKYHATQGQPERYRIITLQGAFHGRTLATISAGGQEKYLKGFGPAVDGFDHVAFGNMNELRDAIGPHTAGILLEPVQGEGGIRAADLDYLRALRATADEFGLLLAFDEVQCGIGRTGKLFAHQWAEIAPDLVGTAKGLGGGFPVGAMLANEKVAACLVAGSHGTTFGGNPLAMAVADALLEVILEEGFLDHVQKMGCLLWMRLQEVIDRHPTILEKIGGKGLMLGVKCRVPNTEMAAKLTEGGLLTVGAGDNNVRLVPPLILEEQHIDEAIDIIDAACSALAA